jgi:hypothetical protein
MTAEVAAIATLNNAAKQIYNIEGDLWQEAYETLEAVINKLNHQGHHNEPLHSSNHCRPGNKTD